MQRGFSWKALSQVGIYDLALRCACQVITGNASLQSCRTTYYGFSHRHLHALHVSRAPNELSAGEDANDLAQKLQLYILQIDTGKIQRTDGEDKVTLGNPARQLHCRDFRSEISNEIFISCVALNRDAVKCWTLFPFLLTCLIWSIEAMWQTENFCVITGCC